MKLSLREFADATRSMLNHSGPKRTRLMLKMRPHSTRKIFILKSTDGRATFTTRVEHQGQLRAVDAIVSQFVAGCTAAIMPPPEAKEAANVNSTATDAAKAEPASGNANANANKGGSNQQQQQQSGSNAKKGGGGNKGKAKKGKR